MWWDGIAFWGKRVGMKMKCVGMGSDGYEVEP